MGLLVVLVLDSVVGRLNWVFNHQLSLTQVFCPCACYLDVTRNQLNIDCCRVSRLYVELEKQRRVSAKQQDWKHTLGWLGYLMKRPSCVANGALSVCTCRWQELWEHSSLKRLQSPTPFVGLMLVRVLVDSLNNKILRMLVWRQVSFEDMSESTRYVNFEYMSVLAPICGLAAQGFGHRWVS